MPELDECRSELLESESEILGRRVRLTGGARDPAVRGGHRVPKPDDVAEVGQPVADQDLSDLALAVIAGLRSAAGRVVVYEPTSVGESGHSERLDQALGPGSEA